MIQQDDQNISGIVQSEMESETRANSTESVLLAALQLAISSKSGPGADQNDKDDLIILQNAKIETEGKKVVIKFTVPKKDAQMMIQRKLAEQKAAPKQPLGNAVVKPNNNTAVK